jgi:hypothetical protein
LSGGTPPRHATHVLVASSDVTTAILAPRGHAQDGRKKVARPAIPTRAGAHGSGRV